MYDYGDHGDYDRYPDYDGPRGGRNRSGYQYHCGGFASYDGPCGASDCGDCRNGAPPWEEQDEGDEVKTTSVTTYHVATKARGFVRVGDMVARTTGFTYEEGGRRTGYAEATERVVARAPGTDGHSPEAWAKYGALRAEQNERRRSRRNRR